MTNKYLLSTPALRVDQKLGKFYVTILPAELLLQTAKSDVLWAEKRGNTYVLRGTQRKQSEGRLRQIAEYIERVDATFPNAIIVAANDLDPKTGFYVDDEDSLGADAWKLTEKKSGGETHYTINIPNEKKTASVIDGQHRLFAFQKTNQESKDQMNLICAVFFNLPKQMQAQMFATINSTQTRVDRSLAFELFGYNISEEKEEFWTPDKLAVFFTRKIGNDEKSPLFRRIIVAPKHSKELQAHKDWKVSTAAVVEGIMRLITTSYTRDINIMRKGNKGADAETKPKTRAVLAEYPKGNAPFREEFIDGNLDDFLYQLICNYLEVCDRVFWKPAKPNSAIFRTIGVQAIFDILRELTIKSRKEGNKSFRTPFFEKALEGAEKINFSAPKFQNFSGSGRILIRETIKEAIGLPLNKKKK